MESFSKLGKKQLYSEETKQINKINTNKKYVTKDAKDDIHLIMAKKGKADVGWPSSGLFCPSQKDPRGGEETFDEKFKNTFEVHFSNLLP